jgi:hypothetical protein
VLTVDWIVRLVKDSRFSSQSRASWGVKKLAGGAILSHSIATHHLCCSGCTGFPSAPIVGVVEGLGCLEEETLLELSCLTFGGGCSAAFGVEVTVAVLLLALLVEERGAAMGKLDSSLAEVSACLVSPLTSLALMLLLDLLCVNPFLLSRSRISSSEGRGPCPSPFFGERDPSSAAPLASLLEVPPSARRPANPSLPREPISPCWDAGLVTASALPSALSLLEPPPSLSLVASSSSVGARLVGDELRGCVLLIVLPAAGAAETVDGVLSFSSALFDSTPAGTGPVASF